MSNFGNADSDYITLLADDDLKTTTALYKTVYLSASMTGSLASMSSDKVVGLVSEKMSSGSEYVTVCHNGLAKGTMLSLTVATAGDWLVAWTTGALTTFSTATTAQNIVGQALTASRTGGAVTLLVKIQKYGIRA